MTARSTTVRTAVKAAIDAAKSGYILSPTVKEAGIPDDITEGTIALTVFVVALDFDEVIESRSHKEISIPIMIGVLKSPVIPSNLALIDDLTLLCEQIRNTISGMAVTIDADSSLAVWEETNADKDETGLPFSFVKMREDHTFESYFTANFKLVTGKN